MDTRIIECTRSEISFSGIDTFIACRAALAWIQETPVSVLLGRLAALSGLEDIRRPKTDLDGVLNDEILFSLHFHTNLVILLSDAKICQLGANILLLQTYHLRKTAEILRRNDKSTENFGQNSKTPLDNQDSGTQGEGKERGEDRGEGRRRSMQLLTTTTVDYWIPGLT